MSFDETMEAAVLALQTVVGADLKADDVEIAIASKSDPKYHLVLLLVVL